MSENNNAAPLQNPALDPRIVGLGTVSASLNAQIGFLLSLPQFPVDQLINLLCDQIGKVLSLVEPEQIRNTVLAEIRRNLSAVVNRHVEARKTTPGGIIRPDAGQRIQ